MKRLLFWVPSLVLVAALLSTASESVCASGSCGFLPLKPLVPLGCDDLVAQCRCDSQGQNCKWEWICVKRR
jgi:hypothetical protein